MEDMQLLIYIVFGVIYVVSRILRFRSKKQSSPAPQQQASGQKGSAPRKQSNEPEKGFSWEDLFKTFDVDVTPPNPGRQEEEPLEEDQYDEAEEAYDKPQEKPQKHAVPGKKLASPAKKIQLDKKAKKKKVNPYKKLLHNPKTLKQSVVVSEILNRKNF